ncbi:molybdenum cofactor guanylyltransferase [Gordonia sp. (in: high G+C Gram-positive bacteria)]|uniref:molybdenum cofactor guanylyltransferase n=1 Tax=Gordonia sp. (in: high G+C Gram-positive bacteria) TaxID=84139 RepID=UPI003C724604
MTAAIVLAGGRASRLGGADKANLQIDGQPLINAVYASLAEAHPVIAVGPESIAHPGVTVVQEEPPFGGPVAGLAAAFVELDGILDAAAEVWVLACDLPRAALIVAQLREIPTPEAADAVILRDAGGRDQWLAGRYRIASLRSALDSLPDVRDVSMRLLVAGLNLYGVDDRLGATEDLDTWDDVAQYQHEEDHS